jgi:putative DNA primase/helicase
VTTAAENNGIHCKTDFERATEKPRPLPVLPDGIPAVLKSRPQWVVWRFVWNPDKKRKDGSGQKGDWDKPPFDAHTGQYASSTEPRTWATFEEALDAYRRGGWDGIGFLPLPEDYLGVIDLDGCRDRATGAVKPWAAKIMIMMDTYTEVSPSGTGLRIVSKGRKPDRKRSKKDLPDGAIEIYDGLTSAGKPGGRYLTFTGHHLANVPLTVEDRQAEFAELYRETFAHEKRQETPKSKKKGGTSQDEARSEVERMTDSELLQAAFGNPKNGQRIDALYRGDKSAHHSDDSAADMALCCHLAFYCHADVARMDRIFRGSRLMRDKWDEQRGQQTYGERTLARAIELTTDFYVPFKPPRFTCPKGKASPSSEASPGGNGSGTRGEGGATGSAEERDPELFTDRGNAIRLVRERKQDLRHCLPWRKWLVWSEGRWRIDDTATTTRYAKEMIRNLYHWALNKVMEIGNAVGT